MASQLSVNTLTRIARECAKRGFRSWRWLPAVALLAALPLSSCSDDSSPQRGRPKTDSPLSDWSIKVYIGPPGKEQRVDLRPIPEVSFGSAELVDVAANGNVPASPSGLLSGAKPALAGAAGSPSGKSAKKPSSHAEAVVGSDDGGVEFECRASSMLGPPSA